MLLGAVQHPYRLYRCGQRVDEMLERERAEEMDLDDAELLAPLVEIGDRLLDRLAGRAQGHDHPLGFRVSDIVEQTV